VLSYQVPAYEKEEFGYVKLKRDISLYRKAQAPKALLSVIKSANSSVQQTIFQQ
jgi:hypothetical protein